MMNDPDASARIGEMIDSHIRLAASIAHKVNNPLTYVMNYLFVLKQSVDDERSMELIAKMERGITDASDRLNELVNISAPVAEQIEEVELAKLVSECVGSVTAGEGVSFVCEVSDEARAMSWRAGLASVLRRLIENSIDAGAGEIRISALNERDNTVLVVNDNGEGINDKNLPLVFEPYFTTRNDRDGLGLFISYITVRSFGGSIRVERPRGSGAEFRISLRNKPS